MQVRDICFGRIRIVIRSANVVYVEICAIDDRVFDVLGTGLIGVGAIKVTARFMALLNGWKTIIVVLFLVLFLLLRRDEPSIGVLIAEGDVRFLLRSCIVPAIVDPEGHKVDMFSLDGSFLNRGVLLFDVFGELGTVVAPVRLTVLATRRQVKCDVRLVYLSKNGKVAAFILRKLRIERLKELPHVRRGCLGAGDCIEPV